MKPEPRQRFEADPPAFRLICRYECNDRWLVRIFIILVVLAGPGAVKPCRIHCTGGKAATVCWKRKSNPEDYTLKYGDFQVLISPSQGFRWNDNVNLSKTNPKDDYIVNPAVGIKASYPLSEHNLLSLDVTVGYDCYLLHPNLSTFDLNSSSGTGLSFDTVIKTAHNQPPRLDQLCSRLGDECHCGQHTKLRHLSGNTSGDFLHMGLKLRSPCLLV